MKKLIRNMVVLAAGACLMVGTATADTIDMNYLIGASIDGAPSGLANEEARLQYFIDLHNGLAPTAPSDGNTYVPYTGNWTTPLPAWDGTSTGQIGQTSTQFNVDVTDWAYLMVKWANDSYYYYVGNLTGSHSIINDVVFNQNGGPQNASHYRLFGGTPNKTPEAGATAILLGTALLGLGAVRRRLGLK